MLHPVGPLPASVYWRRRVLVLILVLSVLGGGGWAGARALRSVSAGTGVLRPVAATASPAAPLTPALEQVVPAVAGLRTPTAPTGASSTATPVAGGPCTDAMLGLAVRAPTSVPLGSTPEFDLVVTNVSAVPCVRALDKGLQEMVLVDVAGSRIWGSNDCSPETSSDRRTLAPGESVSFPVLWAGLTSAPSCTAPRRRPAPGSYLLRGRLDTLIGSDTPLTLT